MKLDEKCIESLISKIEWALEADDVEDIEKVLLSLDLRFKPNDSSQSLLVESKS